MSEKGKQIGSRVEEPESKGCSSCDAMRHYAHVSIEREAAAERRADRKAAHAFFLACCFSVVSVALVGVLAFPQRAANPAPPAARPLVSDDSPGLAIGSAGPHVATTHPTVRWPDKSLPGQIEFLRVEPVSPCYTMRAIDGDPAKGVIVERDGVELWRGQ